VVEKKVVHSGTNGLTTEEGNGTNRGSKKKARDCVSQKGSEMMEGGSSAWVPKKREQIYARVYCENKHRRAQNVHLGREVAVQYRKKDQAVKGKIRQLQAEQDTSPGTGGALSTNIKAEKKGEGEFAGTIIRVMGGKLLASGVF